MDAHEFALYWPGLSALKKQGPFDIECTDSDLVHRIARVLRLAESERCIIFDQQIHAYSVIKKILKKSIIITFEQFKTNIQYLPRIMCLIPLLKKTALEEAIYNAVEFGANQIMLVQTVKTQGRTLRPADLDRLHAVAIAAAEQSKHFAFPVIQEPQSLEKVLDTLGTHTDLYFFDPQGQSLVHVIPRFNANRPVALLVGPEGDLTNDEKNIVKSKGAHVCALTPTILRAQQAIGFALGFVRSVTNTSSKA